MGDLPELGGKVLIQLYLYRCRENGKGYIGVTSDPDQRFRKHAKGKSAAVAFNRAVKKYGIDSFDLSILAIFDDVNAANYHENAAITAFGTLSPNGYNLVGGAPRSEYFGPMAQEVKEKIGKANRKNKLSQDHLEKMLNARKGKPNHFKGKTFSPEHRAKLSEAHKNIPLSPEHRANMVEAHRTPDVREKCANGNKGKHLSSEHREKISIGGIGKHHRPHSEETRAKLSEITKKQWEDPDFRKRYSAIVKGKKRKPLSPETKAKIGTANKARWEQKKSEAEYV